jgi:DNA repair ATPase RecN
LAHVLSLAGVCGGAYNVTRQDAELTKQEIAKLREQIDTRQKFEMSVVDRLARMEATLDSMRDVMHEIRPRSRRLSATPNNLTGYEDSK